MVDTTLHNFTHIPAILVLPSHEVFGCLGHSVAYRTSSLDVSYRMQSMRNKQKTSPFRNCAQPETIPIWDP